MRKPIERPDVTYPNNFPANIDFKLRVIIQITEKPEQSVVLYTCSETGKPTRSYLPLSFSDRYCHGITEIM